MSADANKYVPMMVTEAARDALSEFLKVDQADSGEDASTFILKAVKYRRWRRVQAGTGTSKNKEKEQAGQSEKPKPIPIKDLKILEQPAITVNGTKIRISPPCVLSYEDMLAIEGFDPERILSVIVKSPGKEGICLTPGQKVEVVDGTWIEMADTSGA